MTMHVFSFTVVCVPYVWQKIIIITILSRKYPLSRLSFNLHWITNLMLGYLPIYHTSKKQFTLLKIIMSQMPCLAAPTQYSICTYFLNAYTLRCQPEVFSAAQIMEDKETGDKNTTWKPFKICHSEALCTDRFSINPNRVQHIKPLINGEQF